MIVAYERVLAKQMKYPGFTFVEVLVVLALIGIVAAVVFPIYDENLRQARRADAYDSLSYIHSLQEAYRANNSSYGNLAQSGYPGTTSNDGYYTVSIDSSSSTGFVATATATIGNSQEDDEGCTILTLTVNAANPRGSRTPASCW